MKRMTVLAMAILLAGLGLRCGRKHVAWVADFNPAGPGTYELLDLVASGGNIYVTGSCALPGSRPRAVVAAYEKTGALRWCWTDQRRDVVESEGLTIDILGRGPGMYLLLARQTGMTETQGYGLAFLDTSGRLIWDKYLAANPGDCFKAGKLVVDYSGNACVASIGKTNTDSCYVLMARYRADGTPLWTKSYRVQGIGDSGLELATTSGRYLVAGLTKERGALFLMRVDTSGRMLTTTTYNGGASPLIRLAELSADRAGNVLLGGTIRDESSGEDFLTLLYNEHDRLLWSNRFDNGRNLADIMVGVGLDESLSVIVCGNSATASGQTEIVAIRYDRHGQEVWKSIVGMRKSSEVHDCEAIYRFGGDDFGLAGNADGRLLVARINRSGSAIFRQSFRVPGDRGDEMRVVRVRGDVLGIMWAGRGAVLKLGESRWSGQRWD